MSAIHFYLTFNPFLNKNTESQYTQAHEFHDLLANLIKSQKSNYAYWGKIINKERSAQAKIEQMKQVLTTNQENNVSTHLYITDFNNLWVAKVTGIVDSINKKEQSYTLDFYEDKKVEAWFKISDFTLLEFAPQETARKLSELYIDNEFVENTINGLSPFTTSIRYPTFVQDLAEEQYFDQLEQNEKLVINGHHALNKQGAGQVLKTLHNYAFPEEIYQKLPHAAKAEIEMAELDIIENRHHNLGRIAFSYLKSIEIILNDLVINHIKRSGYGSEFWVDPSIHPPKLHLEKENASCIALSKYSKNFSIGQLIYFIGKCDKTSNFCFRKAFQNKKHFINFMTKDLSKILSEHQMLEIRNLLAHQGHNSLSPNDASAIRNLTLGIGCHGLIHKIYQSFYFTELRKLTTVEGNYKNTEQASQKKAS